MTLEELSALSGLHASFIGQIERGVKKCSLRTLALLASSLGVATGNLFRPAAEIRSISGLDAAALGNSESERRLLLDVVKLLAKQLRGLRQ